MFSRKNRGANTTSPTSPSPAGLDVRSANDNDPNDRAPRPNRVSTISNFSIASNRPPVSPLQMTFDFELPTPPSSILDSQRPSTSDGSVPAGGRKSAIGLAPPVLPPIPRVASRHEPVGLGLGFSVGAGLNGGSTIRRSIESDASKGKSRSSNESDALRGVAQSPPESDAVRGRPTRARDESDNVSTASRKSQFKPRLSFEHPMDLLSAGLRPSSSGGPKAADVRPSTAGGGGVPKMQSSLFPSRTDTPPVLPPIAPLQSTIFPTRVDSSPPVPSLSNTSPTLFPSRGDSNSSPVLPPITTAPPMSRAWIDARDKPYGPPSAPRPVLQPTMSTPDLLATRFQSTGSSPDLPSTSRSPPPPNFNFSTRKPHSQSPTSPPINSRPSVQSLSSSPNLRSPSGAPTNYSGSTARSRTSSKSTAVDPNTPTLTIGTPYGETSPAFPLPQLVATRPKTAGGTSTVAGVSVPTHHTSAMKPESGKAEKRKTRLLNPMALLARRKSAQDEEVVSAERAAQAQALARQRNVANLGVSKLPENFDPSIRGKVVHDFSAPRQPMRNFSYSDSSDLRGLGPRQLQTANSAPSVPILQHDLAEPAKSSHQSQSSVQSTSNASDSSYRRSLHTPVFTELLNENPDAARRISSLQAERLENKDFIQRASQVSSNSTFSQESAILPPFARRSQQMDPVQASFFQDDDSKRSSDPSSGKERDSNISSSSNISPITARSSAAAPDAASVLRQSLSPISPTSTDKGFGKRPISEISGGLVMSDGAKGQYSSTRSGSADSRPPPPALETRVRSPSELTARPLSIFPSQPAVQPIAEEQQPRSQHVSASTSPRSATFAQATIHPVYRDSTMSPEALRLPQRDSTQVSQNLSPVLSLPDLSSITDSRLPSPSLPSTQPTPEPQVADSVVALKAPTSPPRLVEKRASAVGHSKRMSNGVKHHVSNASRFSFQFGGSAAEEQALEDKHRKMLSGEVPEGFVHGSPDEEDEYFDEDAMDDMDEMEQEQAHTLPPPAPTQASQGAFYLQQARQVLRADSVSDTGDSDDEDDEMTYADHPAFRSHSALATRSRSASVATQNTWRQSGIIDAYAAPLSPLRADRSSQEMTSPSSAQHRRMESDASMLTIDTNVPGPNDGSFVQDAFSASDSMPGGVGGARPRSGFYMQPEAAGYSPTNRSPVVSPAGTRPELPKRDSGNSERNRVASGLSFGSAGKEAEKSIPQLHERVMSGSSTLASEADGRYARHFSQSTNRTSDARTVSTSVALSGFSDFHFNESPANSRPVSMQPEFRHSNDIVKARRQDSETIPADWAGARRISQLPHSVDHARDSSSYRSSSPSTGVEYHGAVGKGIRARGSTALSQALSYADSEDEEHEEEDDMYFDDGGFDRDVSTKASLGPKMDENAFDDDRFLRHDSASTNANAMRFSTLSAADGPYPSFAMLNPTRARERDSRLMLEDLVLQDPVDPKLIPQRNPSEDAKRLGLSSRVPPLPPPPGGSADAVKSVQANLQAYHAALADAANKAAADGRFLRIPSVSTTRSLSVYSKPGDEDKSADERSQYSWAEGEEDGEEGLVELVPALVNGHAVAAANGSLNGNAIHMQAAAAEAAKKDSTFNPNTTTTYSPPKMSFDFGFDTPQDDDDGAHDDDDAFGNDDDIVAAANAEALASDADGFYGSEFGFYAKARTSSAASGAQAMHGGFFGDDGDDGLARARLFAEPNLTPITERSEFSTRNSFIGAGFAGPYSAVPSSAGGQYSAHSPASASAAGARLLPVSPLVTDSPITSFDQLRKLRANAFGGSNGSLRSDGKGTAVYPAQGYFPTAGGSPMTYAYSNDSSSAGSNPSSGHPGFSAGAQHTHPSSQDASSSPLLSSLNSKAASAKPPPLTVPAISMPILPPPQIPGSSHSRKSSGADSVTYVRESPSDNIAGGGVAGPPRWVLERRRTSEQGLVEVVGREVVQGGWI